MSCWAVGVTLGILALLFCSRPGCGQFLDATEVSDNATSSEMEIWGEPTPLETIDPIYIHIGTKEITLPCKPSKTAFVFGLNPSYNWTMDNGEIHAFPGEATLTIHTFRPEDSGLYICTITYIKEGQLHSKTFYHTVMGYQIRGELAILLVFETSSCDEKVTREFLSIFHEQLVKVVSHLRIEIQIGDTTCFPTVEKPLDEYNLQVELKVSPFIKGWDEACNPKFDMMEFECYHSAIETNLQKARDALTDFLEENKYFHLGESLATRITFVNTFYNFLEGGKCQLGYGQSQELEDRCPDCCTLCPPGTYSQAALEGCVLCPTGTYSLHYGASTCTLCQNNWLTAHPGARKPGECMRSRASPSRRFPVLIMAFVLPPLGCLCLIVVFCYCFRRRWQKHGYLTPKDEQIDQEKESPASPGGDAALQDYQEQDHSVLLPSVEQNYSDTAIFPLPVVSGAEEATEPGAENAVAYGVEAVAPYDVVNAAPYDVVNAAPYGVVNAAPYGVVNAAPYGGVNAAPYGVVNAPVYGVVEPAEPPAEDAAEPGAEPGAEITPIPEPQEQEPPSPEPPAGNEAVGSPPPLTPEYQPTRAASPPPNVPVELPVLEDVVIPPVTLEDDDFQ